MINEEDKAKIKNHYQLGQGSIQDLARTYRYSMDDILELLGLSDLSSIETSGDLIDQEEAGPEAVLKVSNKFKQKYTLN